MDDQSDGDIGENVNSGGEINPYDSDDNDLYNDISEGGWIQWFCQLEGNDYFVEINDDFVRKSIVKYKINKIVPGYKRLLKTILSSEQPSEELLTEE